MPRYSTVAITYKEKYKPWKRALKNKLKNSACLFPTPSAGVDYVLSRLADLPWDIVNNAQENSYDGVPSVDAALALLDKAFLDADEYGSALVALEKLKMTSEDSVDGFLAKWQKLNIKLGRDQRGPEQDLACAKFDQVLAPSARAARGISIIVSIELAILYANSIHLPHFTSY